MFDGGLNLRLRIWFKLHNCEAWKTTSSAVGFKSLMQIELKDIAIFMLKNAIFHCKKLFWEATNFLVWNFPQLLFDGAWSTYT
jgi:hypothetical protein